jgi:hypothetical protein
MSVVEGPWKRDEPRRTVSLVAWCIGMAIIAVLLSIGIGLGYALSVVVRWLS